MVAVIVGSKNDGAYFTRDYVQASEQRINTAATASYVSGHNVRTLAIWIRSTLSAASSIKLSLYDVSSGVVGSSPVYTKEITVPTSAAAGAYYTVEVDEAVGGGLTGGETLALHLSSASNTSGIPGRRVNVSTSLGAAGYTPTNPWSEVSSSSVEAPDAYIVLDDPGARLIAPASMSPGETITFNAPSFAGPITSATVSDGTSTLTLINITNTSGDEYTALVPALPAVGQNLQYTTFGAVTMSATDGTDTAEDTTTLVTSEFPITILGATFDTGELSWLYNFNPDPEPIEQGDQGTPRTAGITLNSDGGYVADSDGSYDITVIDKTDGIAQTFSLLVGPAASAIGRITRRNLTRRAITRRSLTARP